MNELLLVIPEGWVDLDWEIVRNSHGDLNTVNVMSWISSSQFSIIEYLLKLGDLIPQDASLTAAKLIDDTYFIVVLSY